MIDKEAIISTAAHFDHVADDDIEWIIKYYETAKALNESASHPSPASDSIGSPVRYSDGSLSREYEEQESNPDRCPVCHWTLAKTAADGCVPGNCSYRPHGKG
jgi:hypothetical protein